MQGLAQLCSAAEAEADAQLDAPCAAAQGLVVVVGATAHYGRLKLLGRDWNEARLRWR